MSGYYHVNDVAFKFMDSKHLNLRNAYILNHEDILKVKIMLYSYSYLLSSLV